MESWKRHGHVIESWKRHGHIIDSWKRLGQIMESWKRHGILEKTWIHYGILEKAFKSHEILEKTWTSDETVDQELYKPWLNCLPVKILTTARILLPCTEVMHFQKHFSVTLSLPAVHSSTMTLVHPLPLNLRDLTIDSSFLPTSSFAFLLFVPLSFCRTCPFSFIFS